MFWSSPSLLVFILSRVVRGWDWEDDEFFLVRLFSKWKPSYTWMKCDYLCMPKLRGMEFPNLTSMLSTWQCWLSKLGGFLHNLKSLISRICKAKCFPHRSFMEANLGRHGTHWSVGMHSLGRPDPTMQQFTFAMNPVLQVRDFIKKHVACLTSNLLLLFWTLPWYLLLSTIDWCGGQIRRAHSQWKVLIN
jgi:hypothetical protein